MKTKNIDVLKLIWKDAYPLAKPNQRTVFEKIVLSSVLLVRFCSLSNAVAFFARSKRAKYNLIDVYTLVLAALLTYLLCISYPFFAWDLRSRLTVAIAIYSIFDIVCYLLSIILIDSLKPGWKLSSINRSVLLAVVNFYSLTAAFAILYAHFGKLVHTTQCASTVHNSFHFFYYSLVSFVTLGYGDFVPKDDSTRFIVVIQLIVQVIFLFTVVPVFIGNLSDRMAGRQYRNWKRTK